MITCKTLAVSESCGIVKHLKNLGSTTVWPSSRNLFLATLLLTAFTSHQAWSQATTSATSGTYNANTVAPAPRIEPAVDPREQSRLQQAQLKREQAAQANASGTTPVITNQPAAANTQQPQQAAPVMAAPPQAALQVQTPQQAAQLLVPQQAAPVPTQDPYATQTNAANGSAAVPTAAPAAPAAPTVSMTKGVVSQPQGNAMPINRTTLPPNSAVPTTNPGMDMNINPDLVGGMDTSGNAAGDAVPYEVKLQQRTAEIATRAHDQAFEQAEKSMLPLEPNEIRQVLLRLKDTQEAVQTPARPAPKAGNVIRTISTDPSEKPKTIHLAAGNVTTLNIIDVTGEPWPIVDIGFGGNFDVKPPEPGGHVIRITPMRDFARGNLVVRLLKMTTPITFSLRSGGDTVDYRFDARIPEYGPNAKMPLIDSGIGAMAGDKITTAFLEGAPPTGAEKLNVDGVDGTQAFRFAGAMYVRTPLSLLSPAWQGSATSSDGMNVYVLDSAPVLLLSDKGNLVRARIGDAQKTAKE
jgi:intracellular multiplication protein IcmK